MQLAAAEEEIVFADENTGFEPDTTRPPVEVSPTTQTPEEITKPKRSYIRNRPTNNAFLKSVISELNIKNYLLVDKISALGKITNSYDYVFILDCFDRMTLAAIKDLLEEKAYVGTIYCNVAFANNPWQVYDGIEEPNTRIKHNIAAFRKAINEAGYSLNILLETEGITNWCIIE